MIHTDIHVFETMSEFYLWWYWRAIKAKSDHTFKALVLSNSPCYEWEKIQFFNEVYNLNSYDL